MKNIEQTVINVARVLEKTHCRTYSINLGVTKTIDKIHDQIYWVKMFILGKGWISSVAIETLKKMMLAWEGSCN